MYIASPRLGFNSLFLIVFYSSQFDAYSATLFICSDLHVCVFLYFIDNDQKVSRGDWRRVVYEGSSIVIICHLVAFIYIKSCQLGFKSSHFAR